MFAPFRCHTHTDTSKPTHAHDMRCSFMIKLDYFLLRELCNEKCMMNKGVGLRKTSKKRNCFCHRRLLSYICQRIVGLKSVIFTKACIDSIQKSSNIFCGNFTEEWCLEIIFFFLCAHDSNTKGNFLCHSLALSRLN